jgi:hypothetical protein
MADSEIDDQIKANTLGPKRVKGDSGEVEQHSLKDQLEADRYLNSKKAAKKPFRSICSKIVPPGAS